MSKFNSLVTKLREVFQIDRPDLDFGIYRIMNSRAEQITRYLENDLREKVATSLSSGHSVRIAEIVEKLAEAEKNAFALGMEPDMVPIVKKLRAELADLRNNDPGHEDALFSHLLTFFSRYYEKGDYISKRRYKGDTYAIPYSGEEVVLHWANKDQYYTKSGESFTNYSFKLDDGRTVRFRLLAADTAKDNRKDNEENRLFALIPEDYTLASSDEDGGETAITYQPLTEVPAKDGQPAELIIHFTYQGYPKTVKKKDKNAQSLKAILSHPLAKDAWRDLHSRKPTAGDPARTLLEKHLTTYTEKNTADYFIHKDLGTFLRNELDFYIKNEVLHLDDIQNAATFDSIADKLRLIQTLRAIALDLIRFLAQLEDFQKKLWLKKKFVTQTDYCLTLDRIPETLYPEICTNTAQHGEWVQLYAIDEIMAVKGDDFIYKDSYKHSSWLSSLNGSTKESMSLLNESGSFWCNLNDIEDWRFRALAEENFGAENYIATVVTKCSTSSSFRTINTGPVDVTDRILLLAKSKKDFSYSPQPVEKPVDLQHFSRFIVNIEEEPDKWQFRSIKLQVINDLGFECETTQEGI